MPRQNIQVRSSRRGMWVALALLALLVVLVGVFVWGRWLRYDDAYDLQGTWQSSDGAEVTIYAHYMQLPQGVEYTYTVDTFAKRIDYRYGDEEGHASYRFSRDRDTLVIDETGDASWLVVWGLAPDPVMSNGRAGEGVSLLVRVARPEQVEAPETQTASPAPANVVPNASAGDGGSAQGEGDAIADTPAPVDEAADADEGAGADDDAYGEYGGDGDSGDYGYDEYDDYGYDEYDYYDEYDDYGYDDEDDW